MGKGEVPGGWGVSGAGQLVGCMGSSCPLKPAMRHAPPEQGAVAPQAGQKHHVPLAQRRRRVLAPHDARQRVVASRLADGCRRCSRLSGVPLRSAAELAFEQFLAWSEVGSRQEGRKWSQTETCQEGQPALGGLPSRLLVCGLGPRPRDAQSGSSHPKGSPPKAHPGPASPGCAQQKRREGKLIPQLSVPQPHQVTPRGRPLPPAPSPATPCHAVSPGSHTHG